MALTNCYTDLDTVRAELSLGSTTAYDARIETAISAASRQIDSYCGRFFYQDSALTNRTYFADTYTEVEVDDISTTTGLVVKTDQDDDGTFETTLTITTNYILLPTNAAASYPIEPYTCIRLADSGISAFPRSYSGRPGVQVTAKFGWPAVPDDVKKACIIQAAQLYKATDAVFGGLNFDGSILRVRDTLNPLAAALLDNGRYVKARIG